MPGPALHHMIAERLKSNISLNNGLGSQMTTSQYESLQQLLSDPKNLPYLFLGSQGPDFLFFNTKDMSPTIKAIADFYFEVSDFIVEFRKKLLELLPQPVLDALAAFDEAVNEVIEDSVLLSELQQTFNDIKQLLDGFSATLMTMITKFISEFNLFDEFDHPYRDGIEMNKTDWWWFDALHYRKTGKFTKALLDDSSLSSDDPKYLYALGYLTHYSADTVGHPYVNLISGGPYRSHAQRHKTGENYQDVFNLFNHTGIDWNHSKFHALYNFNFTGDINTDANIPDSNTNLPNDLAEMIANAINRIYQEDPVGAPDPEVEYGKSITAEDVNNAYRIYYKWFRNVTETGTLPYPVAYSFSEELREVWEQAMENLGNVGDFLENAIDEAGSFGLLSIFFILAALIVGAVMAAAAIADAIAGGITTLGTSTIRAAACLIYEQLFNSYQTFRLGVAMNGLAFPMQEHLAEPRLTQFANPANSDTTGATGIAAAPHLPFQRFEPSTFLGSLFNQERHLVYPTTQTENDQIMGMIDSYLTQPSTHYAFGEIPFQPADILQQLSDLTPNDDAINNDDGTILKTILDSKASLGNAMTLIEKSHERIQQNQNIVDFNLDGDRGYSYLCWTQTKDSEPNEVDFPEQLVINPEVKLNFIK
ncbi:MAG: zinc dependent phospholipase C family protein [Saprospiraceae bacterium]|nr:zinc dependent phospholipase C family protein [Saprospiraceae bacterium]